MPTLLISPDKKPPPHNMIRNPNLTQLFPPFPLWSSSKMSSLIVRILFYFPFHSRRIRASKQVPGPRRDSLLYRHHCISYIIYHYPIGIGLPKVLIRRWLYRDVTHSFMFCWPFLCGFVTRAFSSKISLSPKVFYETVTLAYPLLIDFFSSPGDILSQVTGTGGQKDIKQWLHFKNPLYIKVSKWE